MSEIMQKDKRIPCSLTPEGKKERSFYVVLFFALFVWGAFTMWEFIYDLCNIIGAIVSGTPSQAIVQLLRMLPLTLTAFTVMLMGTGCIRKYGAASTAERYKMWKRRGVAAAVMGAVIALYVIAGVFTGEYHSLVEGYVSPLFPLDACLGGLLIFLYGLMSVKYGKKLQEKESALPVRGERKRSKGGFFRTISYMMGLCGFAACLYSTWVMDFSHGNELFNIMLLLNYALAFVMVLAYRFVYLERQQEQKPAAAKKLGLGFLLVNLVLLGLYLLSVQLQNEAPNLNAFGVLPIEFTASFNAFPVLYGLNNIIAPLTALLKGSARAKKQKARD